MSKQLVKIFTYVDGVNDTPFPNEENQLIIPEYSFSDIRMGSVNLTATAMYPTCLDDKWVTGKQYADFRGERYFIVKTPSSSKSNDDVRYKHDIEFVSERNILETIYFYDVVSDNTSVDRYVSNSTKVLFYGDVHELVARLNYSLEYSQVSYRVVVDAGITSEVKQVSLEDVFVFDAIQEIFNIFELPFYFVGKTCHVGFTDNAITHTFRYGKDYELLSINKTNANYKITNRVTGTGSSDNIQFYYPNPSNDRAEIEAAGGKWITPAGTLMPPIYRDTDGAERFYNAINKRYINPETGEYYVFENEFTTASQKEQIVTFEDIKPTIKNTLNAAGLRIDEIIDVAFDKDDNDEVDESTGDYVHSYFYVKLNRFSGDYGFNLFEQPIVGSDASIVMTSGNCNACTFQIGVIEVEEDGKTVFKNPVQVDKNGNIAEGNYADKVKPNNIQANQQDTTQNEVWIALKKDNTTFGMVMPNKNGNIRPSYGDSFVITNIDMPQTYIYKAENELEEAILKYMANNNSEKFTFSIKLSRIFLAENPAIEALINSSARIDLEYNGKYHQLYVSSYTYRSDSEVLPEITIELADTLTISKNSIQTSIDSVKQDIMNTIGGVDFLKQGLKYFLRKDTEDIARFFISFLRGIKIGNYVSGGDIGGIFAVDGNGKTFIETDFLKVRMKAYFETLEIINTGSIAGRQIITPGGSIKCIKVVDREEIINEDGEKEEKVWNFYRCYFLAEQDGVKVENRFRKNDQALSQDFNIKEGVYENVSNHYYWRLVVGVGDDYIDLSKTDADTKSDAPAIGDVICQLGHRDDKVPERQNAMIFSAVDLYSPSLTMYAGINSYSYVNKDYISYGVDKTTNKAFMNVYGDTYIGDRNRTSYMEFKTGKGLKIKGQLEVGSTIGNGSTIEDALDKATQDAIDAATEDLTNYAKEVTESLNNIQYQIDGQIESFFEKYSPTLTNKPAVDWTTEELKKQHANDTFTNIDTGESWKWVKDGTTWKWSVIEDTATLKALAAASKAQDTADGKRRVFVAKPTNEQVYDVGDLWVNATYGTTYHNDILRAKTAKKAGEAFNISHWELASKYTDDTKANEAAAAAAEAQEAAEQAATAVDNLNTYVDGAFKDGVIEESEAQAIEKYINIVDNAKKTTDAAYTKLYANTYLTGAAKTGLKSAKDKLDIATTNLINSINTAIADGQTTVAEKNDVDAKFAAYNTANEAFSTAVEVANGAIQDLLKSYSDQAKEAAVAAQAAADAAQAAADSASDAVDDLNGYVDGAFKDGVIDEAEAKAIEKYINVVNGSKAATDATYTKLYSNKYLLGTAKENLKTAKDKLDVATTALLTSIQSAIADGKTTAEEKAAVDAKYADFNKANEDFNTAIEAANLSIQNMLKSYADAALAAAEAAQTSADAAKTAADNAAGAVGDLNDYVDGAFKDGIIDASEAQAIEKYINIVNNTKGEVKATFDKLYANVYLTGAAKTGLNSSYTALNTAITNLLNSINTAIADGKTTAAEKADVDSKYASFNTAYSSFNTAVETANKAIQDKLKTFADDAKALAESAQAVADAAKDRLDSWAEDGVISPTEKQGIKDEIARIKADKDNITAGYLLYNLGEATAYNTAYTDYYNSLLALSDTTKETIEIPTDFATKQTKYYTERTAALNAIASASKSAVDAAQAAADAAQAAADAAQAAADSASDAVDDLNGYVDGAFKDGVIDEAEAKAIEKYINVVNGSKAATDATYTKLYSNKYLLGTAKENLKTAKDKLDVATTALLTSIQSAIADGKTTAEEKAAVDAKYADFNKANEDFNTAIEAANLSIQNMLKSYADAALAAAEAAQTSADAAKTAADNAAGAVGDLNDYVDGAFKDGIIDASEAQAIEKYINIVNNTKGEVKATFDKLYANVYLTGAAKTGLNSSYTALNTAITNLLNSINTAIADGKTTAAEKADVDSKYASFNTAYSSFNTAVETANKAIQDKLKTFADDAKALAESAQAVADAAKDRLDSWAEDGVISPTEKQGIKDEIARIKADKDNITAGYLLYNLGEATAYNTAYTDYYNSLLALSDTTKETIEIPTDFATKQTKYYTERTAALNAIASASKSAVDAAQAAADAAKSRLDSWAADGVISPAEKQSIKDERARILADKADITTGYTRYNLGTPTDYNTAYTAYDTALAALSKDTPEVITIPSDFATKQKNYYTKRTAAISAIDAATKSNADAAAAAAAKAQEDIDNVKTDINKINSDVAGLKNFTDDAFADGVVDRGEASAIGAYLKSIATVKADVDKSYTEVYANPLLAGTAKTTLNTTYTAFGKAVEELTTVIEAVVEKGIADATDRASVNGKYDAFNTKYGAFIAALNAANTYIQDQIESKAENALTEAVSYRYLKKAFSEYTIIEGGLVQNSLNVLGYTNDKKEFVVQAGMNGIYDASQTHGGIAAWYGGSMKDYFDYTDLDRPKDVAKGVDRMDGTGYRANGNLWWDKNGEVHADPLSFFVGTETVGGLLASFQVVMTNKKPDYLIPKVPFQDLTISNNLTVGGDIILKDGILKWDAANNAFYVEKKDGSIASFYATGEVSAGGAGSGGSGGGGGLIENVYGSSSLGDEFSDSDLNNTFNAYSINQIYLDVKNLKSGAAVSLVVNGTGTVLTNIVKTGSTITATKGNLAFSSLTSKPTTIAGYGITDAYTKTQADGKYVLKSGSNMTGTLNWVGADANIYPILLGTNHYIGIDGSAGSSMLHWDGTRTHVGSLNGSVAIRSNATDLIHNYNGTGYIILDARNYNNYAPKKNGTGAGGNWAINVLGWAHRLHQALGNKTAEQVFTDNGVYYYQVSSAEDTGYPTDYGHGLMLQRFSGDTLTSSQAVLDIFTPTSGTNLVYLRTGRGNGTKITWQAFQQILHTGNYTSLITKLGTATVGSTVKPFYLNAGVPTAFTTTVGSASLPVYMNAGSITACSTTLGVSITGNAATATKLGTATVGSNTKFFYLNAGTPTASNASIGTGTHPIYLNGGVFTASTSTVGSASRGIYMTGGLLTAMSATVGSASLPVYMNAGTITQCSTTLGVSITGTAPRLTTTELTNQDLNSYTYTNYSGKLYYAGGSNTTTNVPSGVGAYGLMVWRIATGYTGHLMFDSAGDFRARFHNGTTWSAWDKLAYITDNVASATKLQTARTINGTSFNGTANITTANWGTARNLTIGGAVKSVNGSANVSFSLNEINAAYGRNVTYTGTTTAQGWYRLASTGQNINTTNSLFFISVTVSGQHSTFLLQVSTNYGNNPSLIQLGGSNYSTASIDQFRLVYHTTYSGHYGYLEVRSRGAMTDATFNVFLVGRANTTWTLSTALTAGSIPEGYTSKTLTPASASIVAPTFRGALVGNVTGNVTGNLTGNASTATSLQTARTLWGQSFNGTANITGTLLGVESLVARSGRINNFSGYFDDSGNPATGTICITLPNGWTSSMNIYEIWIYEYNTTANASVITIGAYNYNGGGTASSAKWINIGYHTKGAYSKGVRLAYNGSKCVILLGTTATKWYYPKVYLKTIYTGHNNQTIWGGTSTISLITSETGYTNIDTPARMDEFFGDTSVTGRLAVTGAGHFGYTYTTMTAGINVKGDSATTGISIYDGTGTTARLYRKGDILYITRAGNDANGILMSTAGSIYPGANNTLTNGTTTNRWSNVCTQLLNVAGVGTFASHIAVSGEVRSTSAKAFRAVYNSYGFFIYNDGNSSYFMLTAKDDQYGTYNSLRPLYINNSTGVVTMGNGTNIGGILNVTNTTEATATTVAAIKTAGGIGVAKQLRVGGAVTFSSTLSVTGQITASGGLRIGNYYLKSTADGLALTHVTTGTVANFYATGEVSAGGVGSGGSGGGGGLIENVYGSSSLGDEFSDSDLNNTFNAYSINQIYLDVKNLKSGAAVSLVVNGTGTVLTNIVKTGSTITATKGNLAFSSLTSKPTTIAGYGITDAYTKTQADGKYVLKSGSNMTGTLNWVGADANIYPILLGTNHYIGIDGSAGSSMLHWDGTRTHVGSLNGSVAIRSNATDLIHNYNGTGYIILDARNYNNYAPKKNGTGAGGNWAINVLGWAHRLHQALGNKTAEQVFTDNGVYYYQVSSAEDTGYPTDYGHGLMLQRFSGDTLTSSQAVLDIFTPTSGTNLVYLRTGRGNGTKITWQAFQQILHTGNYTSLITKLGTATVGSTVKPFYLNAGVPTAFTTTVGSASLPVYMNAGSITACSTTLGVSITGNAATATKLGTATVGSNTKFFYLNAGTPTASNASIGTGTHPIYLNGGVFTASTSTVGSASRGIYMTGGLLTAMSATVGSASLPVYMNAGTITQCSTTLGVSITGTAPRLTTTELTNQDLNSYTYTNYSGKLYYAGGSNTTTNVPSGVGAYGLMVWRIATGYTGHLMFDSAGDFRARFHNGTTWSAWDKLAYITDNVASATKLQTARTINGTSFNGTANITTANWGTARNLTIGGAVKSVNGSANVSFSLNEINAAYGRNVTYTGTTTAQGWYRLASTGQNINTTNSLFFISVTVSGQHSTFLLQVSTNYGNNPSLIQLGGSNYSTASIDQFRLVYHTTYSGHYGYLEVRSRGAMTDATFNVFLVGRANTTWTLSTALTAGSIPEGYTSKTLTPASASIVAPTFRGALVGNVTGNVTGNLTGNASTATSLQTARTLWGQSFNGTANITGTLLGVESLVARSGRINNFSGYFDDSGNPATGTICITLPNGWTSSMNIYEIWIYEYNTTANASVITIGAYNYNGGGTASSAKWINIGYHTKGAYSKGVRLAYNGSKCVILLGTTATKWYYPKVYLKTIYTGHNNQTIWGGTSTISLITSETGYTNIDTPARMDEFFGDTSVTGRLAVTGAGHFGYTYTTMTAGINVKGDSATTGISIYDGTGTTARLYRKGDILYITRAGNDANGILMSTAGSIYPGANNTLTNGTTTNRWSNVCTQLLNVAGVGTFASHIAVSGEVRSTSAKAFRAVYNSYGFFIYNDGNSSYFMLTAKDDQYGTYNSLRPLYINNSTGVVTMGNGTNIGGILNVTNTTEATATTVAAIKTAGGIGVAKQLRVGGATTLSSTLSAAGIVSFTNATDATSTTAAAVKVTGGLGVAKQLRVGSNAVFTKGIYINGNTTGDESITLGTSGDKKIKMGAGGSPGTRWSEIAFSPNFANNGGFTDINLNIQAEGTIQMSSQAKFIWISGGNIAASGEVSAGSTSDRNLKKNFSLEDYQQRVLDLGMVQDFEYREEEMKRAVRTYKPGRHTSLIAQDIKSCTSMVSKDKDGYLKINPLDKEFLFTVVGAVQLNVLGLREVKSEVEILKDEIRELKKRIEYLESLK